ncbi:exosortase-associated protein EpsI, B-type [Ideonella sp. A 288]|uniref:exosortase-associated protein EpsI, B-type n=1 Tax=Ideonella sp. A 288 TaxID=1962181 RepID=UPI000B4B42AF|nr:exosortase-associated protein EpsI, B-type [Ideonella sp. A 288]
MSKTALRRSFIVAGLLAGAQVASVVAVPRRKLADSREVFDLEQAVPRTVGRWSLDTSIVPLPPSPDQQAVLNQIYDQILSRTYVNPAGQRVMLSITYGSKQNQQLRAHRQEVCYSAQGFRISRLERLPLVLGGRAIQGTRMVATQGQRIEPVTYWFTMGDQVVLTYLERELAQLRYAMSGLIPDGYLVRVSSLDADAAGAFAQHLAFANELLASLVPELRRRLVGGV